MTYDFMLNLPRHRHRLLLTTRTDPLDIGYTNASSECLASADTVVPWIASGQRSSSPRVCCQFTNNFMVNIRIS